MTAEKICEELHLDHSKIVNIYPYGSRIYLTNDEYSDSDYVIVYKSSFLPSGAFRDNAISSYDREIQGVCYSRSGFIDAINNYEITALECIFLPEDKIIQKKMNFNITKFNENEFIKKIITKASSSWHLSHLTFKDYNIEAAQKNIFHTFRILDFGKQIKENQKIINYSSSNNFRDEVYGNEYFNPYDYHDMFITICEELKNGK